jgi:hypothetical protein
MFSPQQDAAATPGCGLPECANIDAGGGVPFLSSALTRQRYRVETVPDWFRKPT